jgi:hypothetical protein
MTDEPTGYSFGRGEAVIEAYARLSEAMADCFPVAMEAGERDVAEAISNWRAAFTIVAELVMGSSGIAGMPAIDPELRAKFQSTLAAYLRWTDKASEHPLGEAKH